MKIDSMDAVQNNAIEKISRQVAESGSSAKEKIQHEERNMPKDITISEKDLLETIEKANKAITGKNTKCEFSVHEETNTIMVKVIDEDEGKVIKEIPPEKILDLVAKIWEMVGIIVDEKR